MWTKGNAKSVVVSEAMPEMDVEGRADQDVIGLAWDEPTLGVVPAIAWDEPMLQGFAVGI